MGNSILDVVLGLVLIYITLALLATKLQEMLDGSVWRGRVSNLHRLVFEAVGQNETLKQEVLKNPLVYALYKGNSAEGSTLLPSSGPAAIPPGTFARALLMVLNGGTHPAEKFVAPSAFYSARDAKDTRKVWSSLGGLLAGREASWDEFEAAIALWFSDIGDRSDGWFKRRAQWWSLGVALALAACLNVDSLYLAKTLSSDGDMRRALADIAERVDAQRNAAAGGTPAAGPAPVAEKPAVQVAARLTDAIMRLSDAAQRDKGLASFSASQLPKELHLDIANICPNEDKPQKIGPVDTKKWLYILPVVRTNVELARQENAGEARKSYTKAFKCLAHLSSWLTIAATFSSDIGVRGLVQDAAVAIESAKSALITLIDQQATPLTLKRRFLANPEAFKDCAEESDSRAKFDACVDHAQSQVVMLPFLFLPTTTRQQFCKVEADAAPRVATDAAPKVAPKAEPFDKDSWFCSDRFERNEKLGVGPLYLVRSHSSSSLFFFWLAGIVVTAFFVALGAPFWFDVLSKVVKLRAAGAVRDEADAEKRGRGTLPPPAGTGGAPRNDPAGPGTGPFADARNAFEDGLVARDIIALQQKLPGVSATAKLDTPTRNAIAAYCRGKGRDPVTEELSRELFYEIVGRDALRTPAAAPSARLQLGRVSEQVQPVARKLMEALDFHGRVGSAETRFTPDLRALVVLYRYKRDSKPVIERDVFQMAKVQPAALDEADEALIAEIEKLPDGTTSFPRETAGWLDWAIGELGQVEVGVKTKANSNKRILEYLYTAVAGADAGGDDTAWCGAFVAWVLTRYIATPSAAAAVPRPPPPVTGPLRASNWKKWGTERSRGTGVAALTGALAGDVVLFKPYVKGSSGHVAFLLTYDAVAGKVWALGGNQDKGSRVCLAQFPAKDVVTVRGV